MCFLSSLRVTLIIAFSVSLIGCSTDPKKSSLGGIEIAVEPALDVTESVRAEKANSVTQLKSKIESYKQAYIYLESYAAAKYFKLAECVDDYPEVREIGVYPEDACESQDDQIPLIRNSCEVQKKCDLVSALVLRKSLSPEWDFLSALGCDYDDTERTLLTQSTRSMSDLFCAVGPWKIKNKFINIFRLGRAAACAYSLQNIVKRSDRLATCINKEISRCSKNYSLWQESEAKEAENFDLRKSLAISEVERCERSTAILKDLDNPTAQGIQEEIVRIRDEIDRLTFAN